jgi:hypothetical protein
MVTVRLVTLLALWMLRRPSPEGEAIRRLSLTSAPGRSPARRRCAGSATAAKPESGLYRT